jgi:hypothetical protein
MFMLVMYKVMRQSSVRSDHLPLSVLHVRLEFIVDRPDKMFVRSLRTSFAPVFGLRSFSQAAKVAESTTLVEVKKSNLKQSPLKMQFLAMLVRDTWLPDALAQLKFSPKHKAVDLAKMVKVICDTCVG